MKHLKHFGLLLAILCFLAPTTQSIKAQSKEFKIGESNTKTEYPLASQPVKTRAEILIHKSEIPLSGNIEALNFSYDVPKETILHNLTIWITTTEAEFIDTNSPQISTKELTQVFRTEEIKLNPKEHDLHLKLNDPYLYNEGNIIVVIRHQGDQDNPTTIIKTTNPKHGKLMRLTYDDYTKHEQHAIKCVSSEMRPNISLFINPNVPAPKHNPNGLMLKQ